MRVRVCVCLFVCVYLSLIVCVCTVDVCVYLPFFELVMLVVNVVQLVAKLPLMRVVLFQNGSEIMQLDVRGNTTN